MTIKYIEPDLVFNNIQSRKNYVYSYDVSLIQYFSGIIPFRELKFQQIQGYIQQFQEYHQTLFQKSKMILQEIQFQLAQCQQNRISFVLVLKRLLNKKSECKIIN
ncbi:unnamed protein product [Paramecium pentaurelia]|uniref:Uncharacterized protein n=1 Tax=Paramecium pentaurelia TaxID=43138 RepID=A0A8S1UMF6_9CILI|nr:unnamed protein product [Paramecium pentaurelia]